MEKEKEQSTASHVLFVSCGPGLDEVCVCVFGALAPGTFHVCVSGDALLSQWHWRGQLGGQALMEALGDFVPVRASNLGLNWSFCSRRGWQKEEQ